MDKLIYGIGIFAIAWCVFANYDFKKEDGLLRVYGLKETRDRTSSIDGNTLPKYAPDAVQEYRISQGKVIEKVGTFINEYDNCKSLTSKTLHAPTQMTQRHLELRMGYILFAIMWRSFHT